MDTVQIGRKRRKGIQQRHAAEVEAAVHKSELAELLLRMLAWGIFSTAQVQDVALAASKDLDKLGANVSSLPQLEKLAHAGTSGTNVQNLHRDIMASVRERTSLQPSQFYIPFKSVGEQMQLMTLPHEYFAHIYYHYPNTFRKTVLPPHCDLSDFWQGMDGHPCMDGLDLAGHAHKSIPFGLHGDEVPITGVGKVWARSALTFQTFSLLAASVGLAAKECMLWVWSVFEKLCIEGAGGTVATFMTILKWSWEAWREGKWPVKDWLGNKLL